MKRILFCTFLIVSLSLALQAQTSTVSKDLISFFTYVDGERRYGFADQNGHIKVSAVYKRVNEFHEGMAAVKNAQDKWGYVNSAGRLVVPCKYNDASDFHEGLGYVRDQTGYYYYYNKTGSIAFSLKGKIKPYFGDFSEGLAVVEDENHNKGFIDKTGKLVIPCKWDCAEKFQEGRAAVTDRSVRVGFIDKTGKLVISCQYDMGGLGLGNNFYDGRAVVKINGKYGYIDKTGKVVIPCKWKSASYFSEGLARVETMDGKEGFIDINGKIVIPCVWKFASDFSEGLAKVSNGGVSYIDKTGRVVLHDSEWDWNHSWWNFQNGTTMVFYDGSNPHYVFIDKTGKILAISEGTYGNSWEMHNGYFKRVLLVGGARRPYITNNKHESFFVR